MEMCQFSHIQEASFQDWIHIDRQLFSHRKAIPQILLNQLSTLESIQGGLPINRLSHSLQAATRAQQNNESSEFVFVCLFHDIGCSLTDINHGEISASIIKPYVSSDLFHVVQQHEIFQSVHYCDELGFDRSAKEKFKNESFFETGEKFSKLYDGPSWDKKFKSHDLKHFGPLIEEVIYAKTKFRKIESKP